MIHADRCEAYKASGGFPPSLNMSTPIDEGRQARRALFDSALELHGSEERTIRADAQASLSPTMTPPEPRDASMTPPAPGANNVYIYSDIMFFVI